MVGLHAELEWRVPVVVADRAAVSYDLPRGAFGAPRLIDGERVTLRRPMASIHAWSEVA